MQKFFAGAATYLIGAASALSEYGDATVIRDCDAARRVLRLCVGDHFTMQMLRTLMSELRSAEHVDQLDDVGMVELAAGFVCGSRLCLVGPVPRFRGIDGLMAADVAAPAAATSRPTPQAAHSAPPDAAVPSFGADLDAAALAATLRDASKDGTPFCEECARAARAA